MPPFKIERILSLSQSLKKPWPLLQKRSQRESVQNVSMVKSHTTVCRVVEKGYVSINGERQHVFSAKDQVFVNMIEFALNVSRAKGAEFVNTSGSNRHARTAKEVGFVNMDGSEMSVKNVEDVPSANTTDIDIPAQNAMGRGYANMEKEKPVAVNVEEPPYANMVANAPNANPVADHRIASTISFVARVSPAHQR